MALEGIGGTSGRALFTPTTASINLAYSSSTGFTVLSWLRGGFGTGPQRNVINKSFWTITVSSSGQYAIGVDGSTTNLRYQSPKGMVTAGPREWSFVAFAINIFNPPGQQVQIYTGSMSQPAIAIPMSSSSDFSGAGFDDTNTNRIYVANNVFAAQVFSGSIATVQIVNRTLTRNEVALLQYKPFPISGTLLLSQLGFHGPTGSNGTGSIPNFSFTGSSGTGSFINMRPVLHAPIKPF